MALAGFPVDVALPVPAGSQTPYSSGLPGTGKTVNGGLRNRGLLGGGAIFEGARSPPGTKSMSCLFLQLMRVG